MRRALGNLALLAVTTLVFAGLLEIALRLAFARSLDFSMEMWKYAVALKQPVSDPRLSFAHRPNTSAFLMGVPFAINSMGLRDREFSPQKPPGVSRIVWLGDSTTVGWGVPAEATPAKILERARNAQTPGATEVLNAGVGNYDTVQEVEHYLTIDRAFHPDFVVLEYFINDAEPVPVERNIGILGHSYLAPPSCYPASMALSEPPAFVRIGASTTRLSTAMAAPGSKPPRTHWRGSRKPPHRMAPGCWWQFCPSCTRSMASIPLRRSTARLKIF